MKTDSLIQIQRKSKIKKYWQQWLLPKFISYKLPNKEVWFCSMQKWQTSLQQFSLLINLIYEFQMPMNCVR